MTVNHDVVGSSPTGGVRKKNTIGVFFLFQLCDYQSVSLREVRVEDYTKKLQARNNKGVQANCKAKGEKYGTKGSQFIAHKVARC